jgi:hypothetical protein
LAAQGLRLGAKIKRCTAQCGNFYCISREEKQVLKLGLLLETGSNHPQNLQIQIVQRDLS